jgi:hypothetical protein
MLEQIDADIGQSARARGRYLMDLPPCHTQDFKPLSTASKKSDYARHRPEPHQDRKEVQTQTKGIISKIYPFHKA